MIRKRIDTTEKRCLVQIWPTSKVSEAFSLLSQSLKISFPLTITNFSPLQISFECQYIVSEEIGHLSVCNSVHFCLLAAYGLKIRTTWKQSMSILEANQSSSQESVCLPCLVMSAITLGGLPCLWPDLSFHFLVEWRWLGESQRRVGASECTWPGCIM